MANQPHQPSLNIALLNRLRAAGGQYTPFDQLDRDPKQLHHDLAALTHFGFGIEHHPLHGVAYRSPANRLCPDQLEFQLGTNEIGRRIAVWNRVTSTNDMAARASRSPSNHGLVILAESQSAGRGRRGRAWVAPERSSILMSVLLFPPAALASGNCSSAPDMAWLTALAAVAVSDTVSKIIGRPARIKWPNDVRVAKRKIAGILVEQPSPAYFPSPIEFEPARQTANTRPVVIGIGLNVNLTQSCFPPALADVATSLQIESHASDPLDRSEIARMLIYNLDHWYNLCLSHGLDPLTNAWSTASEHLHTIVRLETHGGSLIGRVIDLDLSRGLTLAPVRLDADPPGVTLKADLCVSLPEILSLTEETTVPEMTALPIETGALGSNDSVLDPAPARKRALAHTNRHGTTIS